MGLVRNLANFSINISWLFLPRLDHHRKAFECRRSFVFFPGSDVFQLGSDLAGFQSLEGPDFPAGTTHTEVLRGNLSFAAPTTH